MEPKALFGIVVMFVVAIFGLAIGADIVRDVQVDQSESITGYHFKNTTVAYNKIAPANKTVGTAHDALHEQCAFTLSSCKVYNYSDKDIVPSTNYTITNPSDCRLYFRIKGDTQSKIWNVSTSSFYVSCPYTAIGGMLYNVSLQGQQALEDFSDWTPTLALVIASIMVIGVLVGFVATRMR